MRNFQDISELQNFEITEATKDVLSVISPNAALITLPANVKGTQMIVKSFAGYDGAYLEDGSGDEIVGVAALLVENSGDAGILRAEIVLERSNESMVFCIELLPAGQSVLVLEKNRKIYSSGEFTACTGWAVMEYGDWKKSDLLRIDAGGVNLLTVENLCPEKLGNIKVYYKPQYADGLFSIGGVSRKLWIGELLPGEKITVSPPDYSAEHSSIVYVQTG